MARVRCPNCQFYHYIEEEPRKTHTFENRVKSPFRNAAAGALPMLPAPTHRETPAHLPNRESHVKVPFDQALITGFFAAPVGGIAAYGLIVVVDIANGGVFTDWGMFMFGLGGAVVTGFSVAGLDWLRQRARYDGLLWAIEELTGVDWDGDEEIGEPEEPKVVQIELRRNGLPHKFESFEIELSKLIRLARAVAEGKTFSNRTAADCQIPRIDFEKLRDKFIERGLATWKVPGAPTQGVTLTDDGLDTIADIAVTPLPRQYRELGENREYSTHPPTLTHGKSLAERYEEIE